MLRMRSADRRVVGAALLPAMLLAGGCGGARLVPVDPAAGGDARRPLEQKVAGALTVSVQPNAWQARPPELDRAFLPIRVVLRNGSSEPLSMRPQDQVLEDDRGGRGRAVPPREVTQQLAQRSRGFRRPTLHVGATGPAPTIYNFGLGLERERPPEVADIARPAFPEDPIPPGAAREGFLYFPLPQSGWRRLQLLLAWTGGGFAHGQLAFDFTASSWP